ncbi:hypothetical protein CBL_09984 [Carabus blaptoides fortunei]
MDIKLDPCRLLSDELTYELVIRGVTATGNVGDKRSRLRACLRAETNETSFPDIPLDPKVELDTCNRKLVELAELVNKFDDTRYQHEYARLGNRLTHVLKRLRRITDARSQPTRGELIKSREEYLSEIRRKFMTQASAQLLAEEEDAEDVEDIVEPTDTSTNVATTELDSRLADALERISLTLAASTQRATADKPIAIAEPVATVPDHDQAPTTDKWYSELRQKIIDKPRRYPKWRIDNGVLYKYVHTTIPQLADDEDNWKEVVPKDRRRDVFRLIHDAPTSGHPGVTKTPGCSRERITPAQKKRKISDAAGSPSCTRSREETPTRESTPTRRGRSESADIASALNKIANNSTTDDYDIFGNFVSSRLRKLGKDYSEEVEHDIINIIFAAKRRKKYDS